MAISGIDSRLAKIDQTHGGASRKSSAETRLLAMKNSVQATVACRV